jgi:hypothetical protein
MRIDSVQASGSGDSHCAVTAQGRDISVSSVGDITVIRTPGHVRVLVGPSFKGIVETYAPGSHPIAHYFGPRWLLPLRQLWHWWQGPSVRVTWRA